MQDNRDDKRDKIELAWLDKAANQRARDQNIAANGRLGMLAMAAIALYAGSAYLAFSLAIVLLLSHLAEQMPTRWYAPAYLAILVWSIANVVGLLVFILWQ
jgi:hypothetical protein